MKISYTFLAIEKLVAVDSLRKVHFFSAPLKGRGLSQLVSRKICDLSHKN